MISIADMSKLVQESAVENFTVWDILGKQLPSQPYTHKKYDTYEKIVRRLRSFFIERYIWMDNELNNTKTDEKNSIDRFFEDCLRLYNYANLWN